MDDIFEEEQKLSSSILRRNRHSSVYPYHWFGPDSEPNAPGKACKCLGCLAAATKEQQ